MNRATAAVLAAVCAAAIAVQPFPALAQTPAAQTPPSVPAGAVFNAILTGTLDSKRLKPGDPVSARVTEPVLSGGVVLVPKNARLTGHVVSASARSGGAAESALAFQFDKAILPSGAEVALTAVPQALAPPMEIGLAQGFGGGDSSPASSGGGSGGGSPLGRTPTLIAAGGTINNAVGAAAAAGNQSSAAAENAAAGNAGGSGNPTPRSGSSSGPGSAASAPGGNIPAPGQLAHTTKGVVQMRGLTLTAGPSEPTVPVVRSEGPLVRLDTGTRLLLVVSAPRS